MIVAAVSNGYAEAAWRPDVVGDHGQSFGPWQIKWQFYGPAILSHVGVDQPIGYGGAQAAPHLAMGKDGRYELGSLRRQDFNVALGPIT